MTARDRVIGALAAGVVLDDDALAQRLGADRRHVNAVCRQLQRDGVIERQMGSAGKIVNRLGVGLGGPTRQAPGDASAAAGLPAHSVSPRIVRLPSASDENPSIAPPSDPQHTLVILPCSASKDETLTAAHHDMSILEHLSPSLARELELCRMGNREAARVRGPAAPAWLRYNGRLYAELRSAMPAALARGFHVLIISGGLGLVLAEEPIRCTTLSSQSALGPEGWCRAASPTMSNVGRSARCAPSPGPAPRMPGPSGRSGGARRAFRMPCSSPRRRRLGVHWPWSLVAWAKRRGPSWASGFLGAGGAPMVFLYWWSDFIEPPHRNPQRGRDRPVLLSLVGGRGRALHPRMGSDRFRRRSGCTGQARRWLAARVWRPRPFGYLGGASATRRGGSGRRLRHHLPLLSGIRLTKRFVRPDEPVPPE